MKRTLTAMTAMFALAAPALAQQPVMIGEIAFGPDLLEKADEYGERELGYLARHTRESLERELGAQLGQGGYTLQVTILDATPNRPTMEQMADRPGLSNRSISIGGARLEGVLYAPGGEVVESYEYAWRSHNIEQVLGYGQWTDARRAITRFADDAGEGVPRVRART